MKTLTLWVKLWNLNKKEDSTSFGPQQGQQTMNLDTVVKAFCRSPVWYVRICSTWRNGCHTFSPQLVLVNDTCSVPHCGWDGLTADQNDTNWVSVGIGWGIGGSCLHARFKHAWAVRKAPQKAHTKKKVKPYLKLMASVHLNMDYGVSVLGGPLQYRLCRFRELLQSSRQLLATLFIQ